MPNDFDVTPTWVIPIEEKYNVMETETENLHKEYDLLSSTPRRQFRLKFDGVTDTTFATILAHYRSTSGQFAAFYWTSVPSYIDGGSGSGVSMYGRWTDSPKWNPKSKSWEVEMVFEEDI